MEEELGRSQVRGHRVQRSKSLSQAKKIIKGLGKQIIGGVPPSCGSPSFLWEPLLPVRAPEFDSTNGKRSTTKPNKAMTTTTMMINRRSATMLHFCHRFQCIENAVVARDWISGTRVCIISQKLLCCCADGLSYCIVNSISDILATLALAGIQGRTLGRQNASLP